LKKLQPGQVVTLPSVLGTSEPEVDRRRPDPVVEVGDMARCNASIALVISQVWASNACTQLMHLANPVVFNRAIANEIHPRCGYEQPADYKKGGTLLKENASFLWISRSDHGSKGNGSSTVSSYESGGSSNLPFDGLIKPSSLCPESD
jgi:hypothetical protein